MENLHIISFLIEGLFGIVAFFAGIVIHGLLGDVKALERDLNSVRVDMERKVHQTEFSAQMEKMFSKFDELRDMLHKKQDRIE